MLTLSALNHTLFYGLDRILLLFCQLVPFLLVQNQLGVRGLQLYSLLFSANCVNFVVLIVQNVQPIAELINHFSTPFEEQGKVVLLIEQLLPFHTTMVKSHIQTVKDALQAAEGQPGDEWFLLLLAVIV